MELNFEDPDISLHTNEHLNFLNKEARNTHKKKKAVFSTKDAGQTGWLCVDEFK